jgi:hypothetical protein
MQRIEDSLIVWRVTETKQSVSQKEVTKPEPSSLFTGEATTSTL